MNAVGKLQFDASKNAQSPTETVSVDVEAIKESVKDELSTQFATQNKKIEKQQKTISKLRQEIIDLRKNLEDNVELIKKLGELKKAGIISNKEFQTKKKQLLDKI